MLWCVPQVPMIGSPCVTVNYDHWRLKPFGGDLNTAKEHYSQRPLQGRIPAVRKRSKMWNLYSSAQVKIKYLCHYYNKHRHFFSRAEMTLGVPCIKLFIVILKKCFLCSLLYFSWKQTRMFNQDIVISVRAHRKPPAWQWWRSWVSLLTVPQMQINCMCSSNLT